MLFMRTVLSFACLVALASAHQQADVSGRDRSYSNAAYFVNWAIYGRSYLPQDLPVENLTHIFYAFLNFRTDGTVYSGDTYADLEKHFSGDDWNESGNNAYGCVKELFALKKAHRRLKLVLSIGGWTWSSNFPTVAASSTSRQLFAQSAVAIMGDWGFDGIDIDWEYPASEAEASDMVLLLKAIRTELDSYATANATGYRFQLSMAASASEEHYSKLPLQELGEVVDHITLMAYDYAGSWSAASGHNANLFSNAEVPASTPFATDQAIRSYIKGGVPAMKLLLGMPTYGHSFQGTEGIGKPFTGVGPGHWEAGVWDYSELPKSGATMHQDQVAGAYYSYDEDAKELISFETPDMIREKAAYLQEHGLGGAVFWEASADRRGVESLIGTGAEAMGGIDGSENWINYTASRYDNIAGRAPSTK